jgi:hypothetical protein
MYQISSFLAGATGRLLRGALGAIVFFVALFTQTGNSRTALYAVSLLLYGGALLNICALTIFSKKHSTQDARSKRIVTTALLLLGIACAVGAAVGHDPNTSSTTPTAQNTPTNEVSVVLPNNETTPATVADQKKVQEALLLYLIEEEKLAHDAYTTLYEQYGARVFGNILQSEATHQDKVLALLTARGIPDPRQNEVGVFKNAELQDLYNTLMAKGSQSAEEAYKVGVAIEEKDIADITTQLSTATDSDIISTLELLRKGSENHLRAFNRQLGKY